MNPHKENNMSNHEIENDGSQWGGLFAGLFVGGLIGAAGMLLLAPQSGKRTRAQIQQKSLAGRDYLVKAMEDAGVQAQGKALQLSAEVHEQADALGQRGQEMVDEQREHLSHTLKNLSEAVQA